MRSLKRSLAEYSQPMLQGIAHNLGLSHLAPDKEEAARQIAAHLLDDELLQALLARLSPQAREALQQVQAATSPLSWATFVRRFGPVREMGPQRLLREQPWRHMESPAEELLYHGLIYHGLRRLDDTVSDVVYIPPELLLLLPPVDSASDFQLPVQQAPERWQRTGTAFLQDIVILLAHIYLEGLQVDWEGQPLRGALIQVGRKLRPPLQPTELLRLPPRVMLLFHHLRVLGLVTQEGDRLLLDRRNVTRWLKQPTSYQRFTLWRAWAESPRWNDLCQMPTLECIGSGWQNDPLAARRRIFTYLAELSPRTWYRVQDWVQAIYERDPDFQRPQGNYDTWLLRDRERGEILRGFEHWQAVEGALLRFYVQGPMAWLDAAVLDAEGKLFALTPAGERWLHRRSEPMRKVRPQVRIDPDFRVHLPLNVRAFDHFRVARIAEWEQSSPHYVYRLTQRSLQRAVEQGLSISRILAFLHQASGARVPARVTRALSRWETTRSAHS